ncbi:uncharacterized protein LOC110683848 [Chenopodium quinoa]|uniref:uncharacterized protein LOC110683848 n=1 Tax=Chenopodium quinoa TaxID=63459 RepID=UPI000B78C152|nr:uncharacterized protein LOC110683848 [Chenopodium quinoa]
MAPRNSASNSGNSNSDPNTEVDPTQNPNYVYFLSNSDLATSKLVNIVFDGTSFNDWKRSMTIALAARNKSCFVDGSLNQPSNNSPNLRIWNRCNNLVISLILNSLEPSIARSVLYLKTARSIWLDLEERFSQSSGPQLFSVQQQLADISQGESEGISEFYTRIKQLWDQLDGLDPLPACVCTGCNCNLTQQLFKSKQSQRLIHFFMKVHDKFSHTKSTILMMNPLPTVTKAYSLLLQEQTHMNLYNIKNQQNVESAAFYAKKFNDTRTQFSNNRTYNSAGGAGQMFETNSAGSSTRNFVYTRNNLRTSSDAYIYPSDFKNRAKKVAASVQLDDSTILESADLVNFSVTQEQHKHILHYLEKQQNAEQGELFGGSSSLGLVVTSHLTGNLCLASSMHLTWILDSGASDHMCADISMFKTYSKLLDERLITIPDGKKLKVEHIGTVLLKSDITLNNVLHVPGFQFNLVSISKLCKDVSGSVSFTNDTCLLQGPSMIRPDLACSIAVEEAKLWHLRLGHMSFDKIKSIKGTDSLSYVHTQLSCPDTPQQNGVVERKHKHLLETGRALFFQSKVPARFWGDCIMAATYIINRMPLKSVGFVTPYERLYGSAPDLSHLKIFGCLCYISTSKTHRNKLDPRATPCVFLGYPPNQKAYKVLNLATNKISISRDVIFYEKYFPFHFSPSPHKTYANKIFLPVNNSISQSYSDIPEIFSDFNITPNSDPVRQSSRISKPPTHFHCYAVTDHWCNLVSFDSLPKKQQLDICVHQSLVEPTSYSEAAQNSSWVDVMDKEISALNKNNTWDIVMLPKGKKAIGCKWVYKIKKNADGSIERYKDRLFAKGFTQKYGVDYEETFSPVVKMSTIRSLISLAAQNGWNLFQLDINNAFLHETLHEEVYMKIPEGVSAPAGNVCRLKKSLYGLKQASRKWFARLVEELKFQGFNQSKNDYSLFLRKDGVDTTVIAVYVDDIIITGSNDGLTSDLKAHLHHTFSIKDLGQLSYFLGIEVSKCQDGYVLSQRKFTKELLQECELDISKTANTPFPSHMKLFSDQGALYDNAALYRCYVGKLNFLTNTRPDLAFAVQTLSQFMHSPRVPHVLALQHTLRYVASTIGQGILLRATDQLTLQAFLTLIGQPVLVQGGL